MPFQKLSPSIVIPNYNGLFLLQQHLPAVIKAANEAEIILVDDASTDESVAWMEKHYLGIRIIKLKNNQRFAKACNEGVKQARGEVVVLLNNDVSPDPEFLAPLMQVFEDSRVAAAGCLEINYENGQKIEGGRAGGNFTRGLVNHWRAQNQAKNDTFWVSGGSGAFRRDIFLKIGGFDEMYAPAYQEDRDLSYRLLSRNYRIVFVPESRVTHIHDTTNINALGLKRVEICSHRNSFLFVWKNIHDRRLIIKHLFWLPYHLTLTALRTKGRVVVGLIQALRELKQVRKKRRVEQKERVVSDREIIAKMQTIK